jgi:transcriptional regulator with XRE-family HTH domain
MTAGSAPAFGELVERMRGEKRLSAAETARRAGISRQHLYRIEKGIVVSPGREVVIRIADALEVKPTHLLRGERRPRIHGILDALLQNCSEIGPEDRRRLEEIEANVMRTLRRTRR